MQPANYTHHQGSIHTELYMKVNFLFCFVLVKSYPYLKNT